MAQDPVGLRGDPEAGVSQAAPDHGDRRRVFPDLDPGLSGDLDGDGGGRRRATGRAGERQKGKRKRGFWGGLKYLLAGPISAIGMDSIAESAAVIRGLAQRVKAGPDGDARVRVYDDRTLDLEAMAYNAGIPVADVRALLGNRRRQTRRAVFSYVSGAIGFFALWIWQASMTAAYTRLPYVIVLLLICGLFCLSAFYNALVNWQCRTERLGTWREFLLTEESWWPS